MATANLWLEILARDGFAILPDVVSDAMASRLAALMEVLGAECGRRNVLADFEEVRAAARCENVRSLLESGLAPNSFAVRGLLFDKTPDANWKVAWHQDRFIAVRERRSVPGFTAWSLKDGVIHVQPPFAVLENMLTVRIHLDDSSESNGPLMVLPGSHTSGFIDGASLDHQRAIVRPVTCLAPRGGAVLMRPLLLHASSKATRPAHRRILHLEFAATELPGELEWVFRA